MKNAGIMRVGLRKLIVFGLIFITYKSLAGAMDCPLANAGFEQRRDAWGHWGGEDTRTDFYGLKAFEGERFARIWGQSGSYQDTLIEPGIHYGARVHAAASSSHSLTNGMYGELKIEWRRIENNQDRQLGQTAVQFDTTGGRKVKITEDTWTLIELPPTAPPPDATHVRVVLVAWGPGGADGCVLFDAVELLCGKGE